MSQSFSQCDVRILQMADAKLEPGKGSSEFLLSLTAIVAFTLLVLFDKITLTTSMMQTVFELAMVYIAGRAIPKTASQLKDIGGGKALQGLTVKLIDALEKERAK